MKKKTSENISINDVAKLSGVSISTVSRVINKSGSVKENNKIRVLDAVKQLNFKPSVAAQRLASGKNNVIALVIPRYEGIFYSFYALELIQGIGTLTTVLNLDLLLHLADERSNWNLRGVGGIIFADIISNRKQLDEALGYNIPSVVINHHVEDVEVNCISIDNFGGGKQAVEYLLGLGHKKIAHITGEVYTQAAKDRLEAYVQVMKKAGLLQEKYIVHTDYSRGQARQAAEKLLKMDDKPTAIFVASDSMAMEVMNVASELGIKIPQELSIVGFDDNPSGLYGQVSLTTVRQPLIKMAQDSVKALKLLMDSDKNLPAKKVVLPTELVVRDSCQELK